MNAAQANALPLSEILKILGYDPQKERGPDQFYFSPFREEKTPSFHVHTASNLWYDFGAGEGGDVVDFACAYLDHRSDGGDVSEALRFLHTLHPMSLPKRKVTIEKKAESDGPALTVVKTRRLRHPALLDYLSHERMIPPALARKYLVQAEVRARDMGQTFHALGMKNADGGYELRSIDFKRCAGRKDVTVIRGTAVPATSVHVFEGMMDMLSALADQDVEAFAGDIIVLHSLSCLSLALAYIENYESYTTVFSWLDNDAAGERGTAMLQRVAQNAHLTFCPTNSTYAPCKDVNEARVMRLRLPLLR